MTRIQISSDALEDLDEGFSFHEYQESGLGAYFASELRSDINGLTTTAGIHRQAYRSLHRLLSTRFPYSIYYKFSDDIALVVAVVDNRRDPSWIKQHLDETSP